MTKQKMERWLPLMLAAAVALGMWLGYAIQNNRSGGAMGNLAKSALSVQQVIDLVGRRYVDSVRLDSIEGAAITDIVSLLDPHSVYIPPQKLADVNSQLQGNFSGIGVEYQLINDTVTFVYVLPNGPAGRAGLQAGDQLLTVNAKSVAERAMPYDSLRHLLRGSNGTVVELGFLRDGQSLSARVARGNVPMPSLDAAYMAAPGIGYIRLNKFAETTYREFMDAATRLKTEGMTKMMLDLRGNGGGYLDAATNIADELLADGKLLVSTKGNNVKTREVRSTKPGIFETGDLVLLLDEFSASASEVLAGALQDNDRGTIVGRRSFGKGLVQEQYDLKNGGALRLTVARYYTPTNRSIQKPYTNGQKEQYQAEVFDRVHQPDSALPIPDSSGIKMYITKKGKKLYDGGGITPDVVVPRDSSGRPGGLGLLPGSNALTKAAFEVFKLERSRLKQLKNAAAFSTQFALPTWVWPRLVALAKADSIVLVQADTIQRDAALRQVKATLGRYVWRGTGYFTVANAADTTFKTALRLLAAAKP
jgi:carboxyl-terminal processing protease